MVNRLLVILAGAAATLALASTAEAGPRQPARSKLECKIAFGPDAEAKVRYEVDARKRQFMAAVEAELEDDEGDDASDDDDGGDIPLFAAGDELDVTIGAETPYLVGTIVLDGDDDELEGAVKLDGKARGRSVRPFPVDFPALAVGAVVTVGPASCVLQDRSRGRSGRG